MRFRAIRAKAQSTLIPEASACIVLKKLDSFLLVFSVIFLLILHSTGWVDFYCLVIVYFRWCFEVQSPMRSIIVV